MSQTAFGISGETRRISCLIFLLIACSMAVACSASNSSDSSDSTTDCTSAGHCHIEADVPTCDVGYVWADPDDSTNLNCVLAPGVPIIASFSVTPPSVVKGTSTSISWNWTYANTPTPTLSCSVDGVGVVANGSTSNISIDEDTTYTLRCSNSIGSHKAQAIVTVVEDPVAPIIATFTPTPASAVMGVPTSTVWSWTYANTPTPSPSCIIDQEVGDMTNGSTAGVTIDQDTTYTLTCINAGGSDDAEATITVVENPIAPVITSFTTTPSSVTTGVPTNVDWNWTYANPPTPTPACTVDQGVGTVTENTTTSLTLNTSTAYKLLCTNSAGSDEEQAVVDVVEAPVAPIIASFSPAPDSVRVDTATNVEWSWSYSNAPTPTPTCTIDQGVGTVENESTTSITIGEPTTFTLTCANPGGSVTAETVIGTSSGYVGSGWEIVHSRNQPRFTVIYGLDDDDLWGAYAQSIWHWEGSRWEEEPSNQLIRAMWGTDTSNIYAVGSRGISHWNGVAWSAPTTPLTNDQQTWHDICGRSGDDIWALGHDGDDQVIAQFDGSTWTTIPGPPTEFTGGTSLRHTIACRDNELWASNGLDTYVRIGASWMKYQGPVDSFRDFWVSPSNELFAITWNGVYRYNGSTFIEEAGGGSLQDLWGLSSDDIYVTRLNGSVLHRSNGVWSAEAPGDGGDEDYGVVYGASANSIWLSEMTSYPGSRSLYHGSFGNWEVHRDSPAVDDLRLLDGYAGDDIWTADYWSGAVLHYDGNSWTPSLNQFPIRNSIFACGPNEVWGGTSGVGEVAHYTAAGGWQTVTTGEISTSGDRITAIWGSSCDDVWFLGLDDSATLILHWNGTSFTRDNFFDFDNDTRVYKLFGRSASDIWGATSSGYIHYDGSSWAAAGASSTIAVWGASSNDIWGINTERISHNDGNGWSQGYSPPEDPTLGDDFWLSGIFGVSSNDIWIVGEHGSNSWGMGRSWHYDGVMWSEAPPIPNGTGANRAINAVWGSSSGYWAVGDWGLILYHPPY